MEVTRAASAELGKLSLRAAELARNGRHGEAVEAWERLRRRAPDNAGVAAGLGAALLGASRYKEASDWLAASCERHPKDPFLLRLQAHALLRLRERRPAIGALFTALDLDPAAVQTHADLGRALYLDGASAAAFAHASVAFKADPSVENASTLTSIMLDLGRRDDALVVVARALAAGADRSATLVLKSLVLQFLDRDAEAIAAAREAVVQAPGSSYARHNLAAALLLHGELTAEAWALYESRAGFLNMQTWPNPGRCWTGGDIAGRTVLVHAEQGLGDTLQFVRYVPMVVARGARVMLAVQPALVRLLQGTPGAEAVVPSGGALPDFDLYCPLLSLPGLFGTTLATIPPPLPYAIRFEPEPRDQRLQVGLVWAGNPDFIEDRRRSIDPALLAPLGDVSGVTFHNLQFGCDRLPIGGMRDAMHGVANFAETASRISNLDLVIAADTSVAHLAATMGKQVWLLARHQGCWRWLLEREDTPWYPTMRIYRQDRSNDWSKLILRVSDDLARLASSSAEVRTLAA